MSELSDYFGASSALKDLSHRLTDANILADVRKLALSPVLDDLYINRTPVEEEARRHITGDEGDAAGIEETHTTA